MNMHVGQLVKVPCTVKPGPFSEERLVSFDSLHGPISGFVRTNNLKFDSEWLVCGTILTVDKDVVEVMVDGSFFTTNGIAYIAKERALAA